MSKAGDIAEALLRVLTEHVDVAAYSESHWTMVADGTIKGAKEASLLTQLKEERIRPLMEFCKEEGFRYSELMKIIPMAFETTVAERQEILDDLVAHVHANYDLDIPF